MGETKNKLSNREPKPQEEQKHPDEWEEDLNPDRMAGQNIGPDAQTEEKGGHTAYDIKELHRKLSDYSDEMLKKVPVEPEGTRLETNATYIDLREDQPKEFTATGKETATSDHAYVAKDHVAYEIWNRLIGEEKPGQGPSQR